MSHEEIGNKDWKDLTDEQKEAAKTLGYTKKIWNNDEDVPVNDLDWDELNEEQQAAAKVLGYDEDTWNEGGCCENCVVS